MATTLDFEQIALIASSALDNAPGPTGQRVGFLEASLLAVGGAAALRAAPAGARQRAAYLEARLRALGATADHYAELSGSVPVRLAEEWEEDADEPV